MDQAVITLEGDAGNGYQLLYTLTETDHLDRAFDLPENVVNVRLIFSQANRILFLKSVRGVSPELEYDLSFTTDGLRLGHNLFLLTKKECTIEGADFRYLTNRVFFSFEVIPLSPESAEALSHSTLRFQKEIDTLDEKWSFQRTSYDEKVREVETLEHDKVELNRTIEELRGEVSFWRDRYKEMEGSSSWRLTAPLRSLSAKQKDRKNRAPLKELQRQYRETGKEALFSSWSVFPPGEKKETKGGPLFLLCLRFEEESLEEMKTCIGTLMQQTWQKFLLVLSDGFDEAHQTESRFLRWLSEIEERIVFCSEEKGFVSLLSAGDLLKPETLSLCAEKIEENDAVKAVYTDSDRYHSSWSDASDPQFKPDFSPDYLMSCNYIQGFFAAEGTAGDADPSAGSYAFILQKTALLSEEEVAHVQKKLCFTRVKELSGAVLEQENERAMAAIKEAAKKKGLPLSRIEVEDREKGLFRLHYEIKEHPLISVIIPNKDHIEELSHCIDSLMQCAGYQNLEILICENNSAKRETFEYYRSLEKEGKARVIQWKEGFNFSAINNFAVKEARGEMLLLLNNDIIVRTPGFIEEMLMYAAREDVGAVGAKLLYPDDTVQHAGVIIGLGGVAAHSHKDYPKDSDGYMNRLRVVQNLSAVTAACLMMRKSIYEEIGGMDCGYQVAFNDADFCMRIRSQGYRIVWTPFAVLTHDESKSRGVEDTPEKAERFEGEVQRFKAEWPEILKTGDPYYNPSLTTAKEDFSIKPEAL